ncbi:MAG: hypothetical protein ACFE9Z_17825 [Promethearchaeota archaeon]
MIQRIFFSSAILNFNNPSAIIEFVNENVWGKKCYMYVLWAIDNLRIMRSTELKKNW